MPLTFLLDAPAGEGAPGIAPWIVAFGGSVLVVLLLFLLLKPRKAREAGGAAAPEAEDPFARLRSGLAKTRGRIADILRSLTGLGIDEADIARIEEALIAADIGVETTSRLMADLRKALKEGRLQDPKNLQGYLEDELKKRLKRRGNALQRCAEKPTVVVVVGVNGVGKTTSIAKLTKFLIDRGEKVLLGAGDTFRAAAVEQLTIWSERVGVPIVKAVQGADPASVAFDATEAAVARGVDYLILDTAGRLHTHENLMKELAKIKRVIQKKRPDGPHEVLLVLDATTGQNALAQAREFKDAIDVTGIILAKLDGTAKGGIVIAINEALDIPVKFVGVGEKPEDFLPFDPERFVEALFE